MARIFYFTASGNIYGVHPGPHELDPDITIPPEVAWIDVPEAPEDIPWPDPGGEAWNRVNPATRVLEAVPLTETEREDRTVRGLGLPAFDQIDSLVDNVITAAQGGNWGPLATLLKQALKNLRVLKRRVMGS